jgi:peroxiredoxin
MADVPSCEARLDVPLRLLEGGATNLGHFCGQKLVVLFCPTDPVAAARELLAYEALAPALEESGAWLVGILEWTGDAPAGGRESPINLGLDPDGSAFLALSRGADPRIDFDARAGAAFLIDRDGTVRHAWPGTGHARRALAGVRERP